MFIRPDYYTLIGISAFELYLFYVICMYVSTVKAQIKNVTPRKNEEGNEAEAVHNN